ncbi:ORF6N domain-containing protein [Desulfonatronum sp. SC1]|uniref:ORF6N domain-containing protein n=1 Tax=Desulfonatronum sp. SC1 TaxID=2109626 RepID=UPI000D3230CD|nr:ORF6N domain-containing protein [Desulfonatronum sp. SC1]PTN32705.1 hypothetical protein C6366_16085 [Desulfonatronum sp. SC1]
METKVLNQAIKRNIARFPEQFRFQLTQLENDQLVTDCDRFARHLPHRRVTQRPGQEMVRLFKDVNAGH